MPSKKKKSSSRNKARKGGNKTKEKLEIPDAQMQRLKIDDSQADEDALLEKAIKLAAAEETALAAKSEETSEKLAEKHGNGCDHGWVETEDYRIIADFAKTFVSGHQSVPRDAKMGERFEAGRRASKEKYPEVWDDPSKLKRVVNYFISNGTQQVLKGNNYGARGYAFLACYFEEYISVCLLASNKRHNGCDESNRIGERRRRTHSCEVFEEARPLYMLGREIQRSQVHYKNGVMPQSRVQSAW
jgi:hypothetical protein